MSDSECGGRSRGSGCRSSDALRDSLRFIAGTFIRVSMDLTESGRCLERSLDRAAHAMGAVEHSAGSLSDRLDRLYREMMTLCHMEPCRTLEKIQVGLIRHCEALGSQCTALEEVTDRTYAHVKSIVIQAENLSMQQKVQAEYSISLSAASKAQADLREAMGDLGTQFKTLREEIQGLAGEIEEMLLQAPEGAMPVSSSGLAPRSGMPAPADDAVAGSSTDETTPSDYMDIAVAATAFIDSSGAIGAALGAYKVLMWLGEVETKWARETNRTLMPDDYRYVDWDKQFSEDISTRPESTPEENEAQLAAYTRPQTFTGPSGPAPGQEASKPVSAPEVDPAQRLKTDVQILKDSVRKAALSIDQDMSIVQAKFELAVAALDPVKDKTEILTLKLQAEKDQLVLVGRQVSNLSASYEQMKTLKGENAAETQALYLQLLKEQTAYEDLEKQIAATNKELEKEAAYKAGMPWVAEGRPATGQELQDYADRRAMEMQIASPTGTIVGGAHELMNALKVTVSDYKEQVAAIAIEMGMDLGVGETILNRRLLEKYQAGEIHLASGGIVTGPTVALVGEAGPEAVIPLSRSSGESPLVRAMKQAMMDVFGSRPQVLVDVHDNAFRDGRDAATLIAGELRRLGVVTT